MRMSSSFRPAASAEAIAAKEASHAQVAKRSVSETTLQGRGRFLFTSMSELFYKSTEVSTFGKDLTFTKLHSVFPKIQKKTSIT